MTQHRVIYIKIIIVISSKFMKQIYTKTLLSAQLLRQTGAMRYGGLVEVERKAAKTRASLKLHGLWILHYANVIYYTFVSSWLVRDGGENSFKNDI